MTEDRERGDDLVEGGENPTQKKIGEGEDRPVDVSWDEGKWGETEETPQEGEDGARPA